METRRTTLVDRWSDGKVDQNTYDENIERLTAEIENIRGELQGAELENVELERVLEFADKIIMRPERLWVESSLEQRQRLQRTLFPNRIAFDRELFGTNLGLGQYYSPLGRAHHSGFSLQTLCRSVVKAVKVSNYLE